MSDRSEVLIVGATAGVVRRLRKSFPSEPEPLPHEALRRRGRVLRHDTLRIGEPAARDRGRDLDADFTAEVAFLVGTFPTIHAVLLVTEHSRGSNIVLADRLVTGGRQEILPDVLFVPQAFGSSIEFETIDDRALHAATTWLLQRFGPHQVWSAAIPTNAADRDRRGGLHRGLHTLLEHLRQQSR